MPQENASCEAGPGTSIRKCFRTTICFPGSINFQTDEYCRQLHLEIRVRNKEERFASSARPGSTWTPPPSWKIFVPARLALAPPPPPLTELKTSTEMSLQEGGLDLLPANSDAASLTTRPILHAHVVKNLIYIC
jgi:hypothetical protein